VVERTLVVTLLGEVRGGRSLRRGFVVLAVLGMLAGGAGCSSDSTDEPSTPPSSTAAAAEGQHLDADAFEDRMKEPGTVLLDVRAPAEFASGHIEGAKNIDYRAADFPKRLEELDKNAKYALYCRTGFRSAEAMKLMAKAGFTDIADLQGGITAWSGKGRAVVKS
jgi:rhodanese-related sulfurtransferase